MKPIVARSDVVYADVDNQIVMDLPILNGESYFADDNFEIGELRISGISAAPTGVEEIAVTFSIDADGILTTSAFSLFNHDARNKINVKNVCGSLTKAEIEQLVADAEINRTLSKENNIAQLDGD